jgi:hypothetical protein
VFRYLDDRGRERLELRPTEEVHSPESLASFAQVPVTNDHPSVGLLNAKNAKEFAVGATGESVTRDDGDLVRTSLVVFDADTISQMESGKVEVSCGYSCDVDETPGHHPVYGRYDAIQRNIKGNHVAIVDSARAGRSARIRMDGAATIILSPPVQKVQKRDMDPKQLEETIRSLSAQLQTEKERADAAEAKFKESQTRADVAEGKLMTVEGEAKELRTRLTSQKLATETAAVKAEKERADSAEAKVARFDATLEKRVRERSKLERQAYSVMGNEFRMDDLTDREIMAAVVKRLDGEADVSKSTADGIIQGRFLSLLDGYHKNARAQARVAEVITETREDAPRLDSKDQRNKKLRDSWKKPLPNDIRANQGK